MSKFILPTDASSTRTSRNIASPASRDAPQIEIVLIDRKDLPSAGAGESGIIGLAPAVGNAIFAATGTRLRNMPMASNGTAAVKSASVNQNSHEETHNSRANG